MLTIAVRELEERIEKKKKQIAAFKERFKIDIDKYTKQDEILLALLEEQEQTNNLLVLNNRILFTLLKTQFAGDVPVLETLEGFGGTKYRTRVIRFDNVKQEGKVFNLQGAGVISEVELISDDSDDNNKDYSVRIMADDNIIYDNSWDVFETRNMHEADMTAFDDNNNDKFVLLFQDICYEDYCSLEIYNMHTSCEFDYINVKYHEKISLM